MSSLLQKEVAHFKQLARAWQNPNGPLYTLHRLNPTRLAYIRKFVKINKELDNFNPSQASQRPLNTEIQRQSEGASYHPILVDRCLDIGCGAGIATKELANWCTHVKGVEPTSELVEQAPKLPNVKYYNGLIEELVETDANTYDLVTALEVVEHVADIDLFVSSIAKVMKPNATLIMSTLNRTPKSWLLGIVAAEYLSGIVPLGTHDWNQFVKPEELIQALGKHGIEVIDVVGVIYNPITQHFSLSYNDFGVNYMLAARKTSTTSTSTNYSSSTSESTSSTSREATLNSSSNATSSTSTRFTTTQEFASTFSASKPTNTTIKQEQV